VEQIKLNDEVTLTTFEENKQVTHDHYAEFYKESREIDQNERDQALSYIPKLIIEEENGELIKQVSEEEILEAIKHFNPNEAPGPDGFSAHFYKKF
jgi:hypothetical protein